MRGGSFGFVAESGGFEKEGERTGEDKEGEDKEGEIVEGGVIEGGVMEGGETEGEDKGDENRGPVEDDRKKGCRSIKEKRVHVLSFRLQMMA